MVILRIPLYLPAYGMRLQRLFDSTYIAGKVDGSGRSTAWTAVAYPSEWANCPGVVHLLGAYRRVGKDCALEGSSQKCGYSYTAFPGNCCSLDNTQLC